MHIREIQKKDNPQIAAIVRKNLEQYQLNLPGTAYFDVQLDHLFEFYQTISKANYWVLVDAKDQVFGGVGVAPFAPQTAELQKIYLHPSIKRQGYGQQLLNHATTFAQEHYQALYLETSTILHEAHQLYLKNGFQLLKQPLGASGHDTMNLWMIKHFQPK